FSSRRRHTRSKRDWSSDVCSSDLEPFPTFQTSEFPHFGKALQIIDALGNLVIAEKSYFQVMYTNQALASFLFNVHPLPIIWVAACLQSLVVGAGIFDIGMLLVKRTIPSL